MVYSYTSGKQTVNTDSVISFTNDSIKTGCTVTHTAGSGIFILTKPGYYYVTVTADATATADAVTDPIVLELYNGTTPLSAAIASELSESTTDVVNLTINAIIKVLPSCCMVNNDVTLNVVNTGVNAILNNITITITKIA